MAGKRGCAGFVLLDRDGTIVIDKHYQKDPALTELMPHACEGLSRLRSAGFDIVMITNQSGIGRGLLTRADLAAVNQSVIDKLGGGDDCFQGIYYCPHVAEDGCDCRKPGTGLIRQASAELGFAMSDCYVVGDRACDMEMGRAAGAVTVLVRTGGGREAEKSGVAADYVADDLLDAAGWIMEHCARSGALQ